LSHAPDVASVAACANCGSRIELQFCPACGQGRGEHSRSVFELLHELVEHHFFIEGRSLRSIAALCLAPGRLTQAFIAGRRASYLSPIRLYLLASVVFLVTLWGADIAIVQFGLERFASGQGSIEVIPSSDGGTAADDRDLEAFARTIFTDPDDPDHVLLPTMSLLSPAGQGFAPPESWKLVSRKGGGLVQRIAEGAFYEIALHGQTFAFLLLSLAIGLRAVLPNLPYVEAAYGLIVLVYTFIAFRRVYGTGWFGTTVEIALIGGAYLALLLAGMVGILAYGFATITA